jgi:RNA polymerase sigma factor (sigma-70 family)
VRVRGRPQRVKHADALGLCPHGRTDSTAAPDARRDKLPWVMTTADPPPAKDGAIEADLARYDPMALRLARKILRKLPPNVLLDDVVAAARSGLFDALRRGEERGPGFEWYLRTRIVGAIYDELRAEDVLKRRMRNRCAKGDASFYLGSFEDLATDFESDARFGRADASIDAWMAKDLVEKALAKISPRDAGIVRMAALDGVPMKEVAERMGLSQPRISQLYARGVEALRLEVEKLLATKTPKRGSYRGRKVGSFSKRTLAALPTLHAMRAEGESIRAIARATGLSKRTVVRHAEKIAQPDAMRALHARKRARATAA